MTFGIRRRQRRGNSLKVRRSGFGRKNPACQRNLPRARSLERFVCGETPPKLALILPIVQHFFARRSEPDELEGHPLCQQAPIESRSKTSECNSFLCSFANHVGQCASGKCARSFRLEFECPDFNDQRTKFIGPTQPPHSRVLQEAGSR